eukprot:s91_g29.t1
MAVANLFSGSIRSPSHCGAGLAMEGGAELPLQPPHVESAGRLVDSHSCRSSVGPQRHETEHEGRRDVSGSDARYGSLPAPQLGGVSEVTTAIARGQESLGGSHSSELGPHEPSKALSTKQTVIRGGKGSVYCEDKRSRSGRRTQPPALGTGHPQDPSVEENITMKGKGSPKRGKSGDFSRVTGLRPGPGSSGEARGSALRRISACDSPNEGGGSAVAGKNPRRPKSPLVKSRVLKHPPTGETGQWIQPSPYVPDNLSDYCEGCPVNLLRINLRNLSDWGSRVQDILDLNTTFVDLGRHLMCLLAPMPSPLGNFVRSYCLAAQPLTEMGTDVIDTHGELLPIPVWLISTRLPEVADSNVDWLKAIICTINFQYCTGWAEPGCVPIKDHLSKEQAYAVSRLARLINANVLSEDTIARFSDCLELIANQDDAQAGRPFEHVGDMDCNRLVAAWPQPGNGESRPIEPHVSPEARVALSDPSKFLLPREMMPSNALRAKVLASDSEWFKIVRAAWERGLMKPVEEATVPRDRTGHLITCGAGATSSELLIGGRMASCQGLVIDVSAINSVTIPLGDFRGAYACPGELTGFFWEENETRFGASGFSQSICDAFKLPDQWLGFFSFCRKADGSAMDLPAGTLAGIPKQIPPKRNVPLPPGRGYTVLDIDWLGELEVFNLVYQELQKEEGNVSEWRDQVMNACDRTSLPRDLGRGLLRLLSTGARNIESDDSRGKVKLSKDKLRDYIQISLGLLAQGMWRGSQLRKWCGRTMFMASFNRSLLAGMGCVLDKARLTKDVEGAASAPAADEILVLCCQSVLSQASSRVILSEEISMTSASVTGGATATATRLRRKLPGAPEKLLTDFKCGQCATQFDQSDFAGIACPTDCGEFMCSLECFAAHRHACGRELLGKPSFGERFCTRNCPLSRAVAGEQIFIQPPLGMFQDDWWDFFSRSGRECLEGLEDDGHLLATHWSPDHRTFSEDGAAAAQQSSNRSECPPSALRSRDKPWGVARLNKDDQVRVRQANAMCRRSLQGVKEAHRRNRYASLSHPWDSFLWWTPEARELWEMPGMFMTTFSLCCFGGKRSFWMTMVHNIEGLHVALHTPQRLIVLGMVTNEA